MSTILVFAPAILLAAIIDRLNKPTGYRKQNRRTFEYKPRIRVR